MSGPSYAKNTRARIVDGVWVWCVHDLDIDFPPLSPPNFSQISPGMMLSLASTKSASPPERSKFILFTCHSGPGAA